MISRYLLLISLAGCALSAILLGYSAYIANLRQKQAFRGDQVAAKYIVLPCYKPIVLGMIVLNVVFVVALAGCFANPQSSARRIVQYLGFCLLGIYSITPVLLVQSSVSIRAFWTMFFTVFPWWSVCTLLWFVGTEVPQGANVILGIYTAAACLPPAMLSLGILTKAIKSRVQLGSTSNRNAAELLLTFSVVYAVYMIARLTSDNIGVDLTFASITLVSNVFFPWLNHRTLLADTKFWRGLGRHNQGGLELDEDFRQSGVDVHRPTMELNFVTSSLQSAMAGVRSLAVDFAYLQLTKYLGQGASAKVYQGRYRNRVVAIKLSTPPEVDEEIINMFMAEASLSASLKHRNIVQFVGICVRPPQIGMVFEFCEGGNLKTSLTKQPLLWTSAKRLRACLDAAQGVAFLHNALYMHRDIKAENFLVGKKMTVKLSDFGESSHVRSREEAEVQRMTILGTVAFMAPELIAGARHYTEAIDIYALGITFWEIWTGRDPYDGLSTFEVYNQVNCGQRPPLPDDLPTGFHALMQRCWAALPEERPRAAEVVSALESILEQMRGVNTAAEPDDDSERVTEVSGAEDGEHKAENRGQKSFSLEGLTSRLSLTLRPHQRPTARDLESAGELKATEMSTISSRTVTTESTQAVCSPIHPTEEAPAMESTTTLPVSTSSSATDLETGQTAPAPATAVEE